MAFLFKTIPFKYVSSYGKTHHKFRWDMKFAPQDARLRGGTK